MGSSGGSMKEQNENGNEVMSYKGLSAYLKLSQNTLRHKVMREEIPFFKIGGAVRFSKVKIDAWLEEHHQGIKQKQINHDAETAVVDGGKQ